MKFPLNINKQYHHVILSSENQHDDKYPVVYIETTLGSVNAKNNTQLGNDKLGFYNAINDCKQALQVSILPSDYITTHHTKAFSGMDKHFMRSEACVQSCAHHIDNYKKNGVEKCYMKTLFDLKPKASSSFKKQREAFLIKLPYEIRASYIGDISKCSSYQQSILHELISNSEENYCYSADHQALTNELKSYFQVSATTYEDCYYALSNGFCFYLSCSDEDKKRIMPRLKKEFPNLVVYTCTTSIYSDSSCYTCTTKCNGKHNIIAITKNAKKLKKAKTKNLKRLSGIQIKNKGFSEYHLIYDLLLMCMIAVRLKSFIIFYFYLFCVYFFDLVDFIINLFQ